MHFNTQIHIFASHSSLGYVVSHQEGNTNFVFVWTNQDVYINTKNMFAHILQFKRSMVSLCAQFTYLCCGDRALALSGLT